MLGRRREHLLAILALLVLNALLGWFLARLRTDYRNRTQWIHARPAASTASSSSGGAAETAGAQDWSIIVNHNLFSPERSNPPPEEKQAKAPELPLLFGTMNLGGGWFALMAPGDQPSPASKRVLPGDDIGGYKLVSIANSQVIVEWGEKKFTIDVSESARRVPRIIDKTASARVEHPAASTSVASAGAASPRITTAAPAVTSTGGKKPATGFVPQGADPDAPVGTIVGGRQKVVVPTPFGPQVQWQEVEQPGTSAPTQNPKKEQ